MVAWLLFAMLFVLAAFAIVVTYAVFAFISLYYVYKSCNPDTAVVFLVLSIVIPATMPFFLLADRNLDRGCPPGGRSPSLCRRLRRMWSQPGKNLRKPRRRSLRAHLKNCKKNPGDISSFGRRYPLVSGHFFKQWLFYPFIQQQGQQGDHSGFQQIERRHREEHQRGHGVNLTVDGATHGDNLVQRKSKKGRRIWVADTQH